MSSRRLTVCCGCTPSCVACALFDPSFQTRLVDEMFSKDLSYQVALAGAPEALRVALLARGLDQPGVVVTFVQDILAEGTSTAVLGTGIAATIPPIVIPLLSRPSFLCCIFFSSPFFFSSPSPSPSPQRLRYRLGSVCLPGRWKITLGQEEG